MVKSKTVSVWINDIAMRFSVVNFTTYCVLHEGGESQVCPGYNISDAGEFVRVNVPHVNDESDHVRVSRGALRTVLTLARAALEHGVGEPLDGDVVDVDLVDDELRGQVPW
jgi:hypothetical protein